ncbi:divergent polysaccharide deacetylase family protein [Sneathiella sp. P13V-1]|uniref:divergent polysaccharide deacetylase family protein n=1 Tax=Sneathiella sp. P13V-1 TaxID=2697366 RepID=UPI00187B9056|nr:divergent polysaccharide deacetylase family protein [Sneathiella sp. P13V-1]MBE7637553.1 divergent polysaccharide deacetylase family protein [Sneathiella sp. P13V-1]
MAKKKKTQNKVKHEEVENPSSIWESPTKIISFCVAVLVLSLATGMLVGGILDDEDEDRPKTEIAETKGPSNKPEALSAPEVRFPAYEEGLPVDRAGVSPEGKRDPLFPPAVEEEKTSVVATLPPEDPEAISKPPKVSSLDGPAWERFAAQSEERNGRPAIAIVIDDVGLNKGRVIDLANLPAPLTFAFLPYGNGLQESADLSRNKGHEIMVHMPMEPSRKSANPGPNALLTELSLKEIEERTRKNLASFDGFVGINNHMGSKFTAYREGMRVVMDVVAEKGLLFLDSRTTAKSTGYQLAKERGLPTANRDIFLDNTAEVDAILKQLQKVEEVALKNGQAIAIGHPYKETIEALKKWIPEARRKGFVLIPVTAALVK